MSTALLLSARINSYRVVIVQQTRETSTLVYMLPFDEEAANDLAVFSPARLGLPFDARPGNDGEPPLLVWNWLFGSRMLARFGSEEAKSMASESPVIRAIDAWRKKLESGRKRNECTSAWINARNER